MPASDWLTHAVPLDDFDVDSLLEREWLCTNGTGAYAMGTAAGCNTRRYHGLFVAAQNPPVGRIVALNQMLETLLLFDEAPEDRNINTAPKQSLDFSTCMFSDKKSGQRMFEPHGWTMLRRFDRRISVLWVYGWGRLGVQRELRLHWKKQAATLRYRITGLHKHCGSALLKLAPMLSFRDFHGLLQAKHVGGNPISSHQHKDRPSAVTLSNGDLSVTIDTPGASYQEDPQWWYDIQYPVDAERGQGSCEDYFLPGRFEIALPATPKVDVELTISLGEQWEEPVITSAKRAEHLTSMLDLFAAHADESDVIPADYGVIPPDEENPDLETPRADRLLRSLVIAADDFVVDRTINGKKLSTILAGFPWFADWGRDTFIALPGLLLVTGRHEEAKKVLQTFASSIKNGLVPNRFDDYVDDAAHYNTVDGSLWFVHAALQYLQFTDDQTAWTNWLAEACAGVLDAYERGTDHAIGMDTDGLITAGSPGTQLTWMDAAAVNAQGQYVVFTPRHGKAVEINALWHHGLVGMAGAIESLWPDRAKHYRGLADRARAAYTHLFWNLKEECLFDHVTPDGIKDGSIRPNQIFAASLKHGPLDDAHRKKVLAAVRRKLLTPVGLRTLPPDDINYHGSYSGIQFGRDEAYHQGTVWPWLIGPYAEAALRAGGFSSAAKQHAWQAVRPLVDRMLSDGLGQLHEVHEANVPHRPVGCIAQAWSVAELLRVLALIQTT